MSIKVGIVKLCSGLMREEMNKSLQVPNLSDVETAG
jgi:hypothetical protein